MNVVMLLRDHQEHSIPEALREVFEQIADAFVAEDWDRKIDGVATVTPAIANDIQASVEAYGDRLAPLNPSTWENSCYRWKGNCWEALVDLTTASEPVSDLTLHATIWVDPLLVEVRSVHVS